VIACMGQSLVSDSRIMSPEGFNRLALAARIIDSKERLEKRGDYPPVQRTPTLSPGKTLSRSAQRPMRDGAIRSLIWRIG